MQDQNQQNTSEQEPRSFQFEGLLWLILAGLCIAVIGIVIYRYREPIRASFMRGQVENFDQVIIKDNYHDVSLENGQSWDISYETGRVHSFSGLVRHISPIHEQAFAILTFDILVTNGDFANPDLVQTSVTNHHFTWSAPTLVTPHGEIHLLHTVPANEAINQRLMSIHNGDEVTISGYEIYRIEGYDSADNYIGFWQDSGCNTTLVTEVKINE